MQTPDPSAVLVPRELPVLGGQLALDFANTEDDPGGPAHFDHIASYPGLLAWSTRLGVLSSATAERLESLAVHRPSDVVGALTAAHDLRRVVNVTFAAIAHGSGAETDQWLELRPFLVAASAHALLVPTDRGYGLGWDDADALDAMLWPVAQAVVDLLTGPDLGRVKQCAGCPWVFLDRSKNGSRRWCAMNDCGKHQKIVRYVSRRAERRTQQRLTEQGS